MGAIVLVCGEPMPRENRLKWIRAAGLASTAGLVLVVAIVIGWAFGSWLDKKLGTDPWLMLLFTLMGIAAGFIEMFRIVLSISREEDS
jgi:F0F1-type ATP synthase assembly protein I